MLKKPRSDAKLLNLPADHQATLTQWLLDGLPYTTVQQRLRTEFSIQCSTKVISNYWHQIVSPILADQRAHLNDRARSLAQARRDHPHTAEIILADRLESRLLELAAAGKLPDDPVVIVNLLTRLRRQQLQEDKFNHQLETEARERKEKTAAPPPVDYTRPLTDEERQAVLEKMKDLLGLTPDLPPPIPEPAACSIHPALYSPLGAAAAMLHAPGSELPSPSEPCRTFPDFPEPSGTMNTSMYNE